MKDHELTILLDPALEADIDPALNKVREIIKVSKGEIVKEENDGKKRLAYMINGKNYAIYYYFDLKLPKEAPRRISTALDTTEEVIRYLLVIVDTRKANKETEKKRTKQTPRGEKS